jgi:anti-anti-sigma regulatory factor
VASSGSFHDGQDLRIDRDRRDSGIAFAAVGHRVCGLRSWGGVMLRITVASELDRIHLKLEGDLSGAWVAEVEESWLATYSMRGDRQLYLDLTGVQHVDRAGRYLLGLLRCSGAHLVASGVQMTELVRTIQHDWPGPKAP